MFDEASNRIGYPELLVKADTWENAEKIIKAELGVDRRFDASDKKMNGYYLVRLLLDTQDMTQVFYESIKKSSRISLLHDGNVGQKNREEMLRCVARVEYKLRKLLVYITDSVDNYLDLFSVDSTAKKRAKKGMISPDSIDPLTSYLTFGGMIDLLSLDLSLSAKNTTVADLAGLIESAGSFTELKSQLKVKLKKETVWDLIAKGLLKQPLPWSGIEKDLKDLKEYRNQAAHFRCITTKDVQTANEIAKRIHPNLQLKEQAGLSEKEKNALRDLFDSIYDSLEAQRKIHLLESMEKRLYSSGNTPPSSLAETLTAFNKLVGNKTED